MIWWGERMIRVLVICTVLGVLISTSAAAESKFFAVDRAACQAATGVMNICVGGDCRPVGYEAGRPSAENVGIDGLQQCREYEALFNAINIPDAGQLKGFSAPKLEVNFDPKQVQSGVPLIYEKPDSRARIEEVIPVYLQEGDAYPVLFVFWAYSQLGGKLLPLQILQYDADSGAYVDNTAQLFEGPVPQIDFPRNADVLQHEGKTTIFIANQGHDGEPFTLADPTLITTNRAGKFVDLSSKLRKDKQFFHDASVGVINQRGDVGIFVNSMHIPEFYVMKTDNSVTFARDRLPTKFHGQQPKFTSSAMTDVNGDGLADIIMGSVDQAAYPSVVLLNDGRGNFAKARAIELPRSPLQDTRKGLGAIVVAIEPVHLTGGTGADLLVTSTNALYKGNTIQLLTMDGPSSFSDVTPDYFKTPEVIYENHSGQGYTWVKRIRPFEVDGVLNFVTQSDSNKKLPSYYLRNDGSDAFEVGGIYRGRFLTNAANFGDEPMLITVWGWDDILLERLPSADTVRLEVTP